MQQQEDRSVWTTTRFSKIKAAQQAGLAQNQFALSNFQRQNVAGDVANLGQLGAFRQGLDQSRLKPINKQHKLQLLNHSKDSTIWNRNYTVLLEVWEDHNSKHLLPLVHSQQL